METKPHQNPPSFSIKTPFSDDVYKTKLSTFEKSKFKQLSINYISKQGGKEQIKLHGDFLEDDFNETLALFQSNEVLLPEKLDPTPI